MNVLSKTGHLGWRGESDQLLLGPEGLSNGLNNLDRSYFVLQNAQGEIALAEVGCGDYRLLRVVKPLASVSRPTDTNSSRAPYRQIVRAFST